MAIPIHWFLESPGIAVTGAWVGALTGAMAALMATWVADRIRECRRGKRVASAIVCELRIYERTVTRLIAASKHEAIIYGQGFSQRLFAEVVDDLIELGPVVFLKVRTAYSYCGQVDYLIGRFERRHELPAIDAENLIPAYVAACEGASEAIRDALAVLKSRAAGKAYKADLHEIRGTPLEDALNRPPG